MKRVSSPCVEDVSSPHQADAGVFFKDGTHILSDLQSPNPTGVSRGNVHLAKTRVEDEDSGTQWHLSSLLSPQFSVFFPSEPGRPSLSLAEDGWDLQLVFQTCCMCIWASDV